MPWPSKVRLKLNFNPEQVYDEIVCVLNLTKRFFFICATV